MLVYGIEKSRFCANSPPCLLKTTATHLEVFLVFSDPNAFDAMMAQPHYTIEGCTNKTNPYHVLGMIKNLFQSTIT